MLKKVNIFIALVVLFSLVLAACGGGGGSGDDASKRGEELFSQSVIGTEAGCSTCHSLDAGVTIVGPSLAGIGTTAATRISGTSAEDYITQSIVDPDAYLVEGFPSGTMPGVWEEVLTAEQLSDLVAFLGGLK